MAVGTLRTGDTAGSVEADSVQRIDPAVASLARPRQRRPSYVVAGLLCIAVAALGGALLVGSLTSTTTVLAADADIEPGQIIGPGDLRVVELSVVAGAATVSADDQSLVLGRAARGPIPAGTLLNSGLFVDSGGAIPEGMAVVGAALDPGAVPVARLRAGDVVDVIGVATGLAGLESSGADEAVVLARADIWAVDRPSGAGGRTVVAMLVPVETQTAVAQAAADGRLRLALAAG